MLITTVAHHLQCCPGIPPKEVSQSFITNITGWPIIIQITTTTTASSKPANYIKLWGSHQQNWRSFLNEMKCKRKLTEAQLNSILFSENIHRLKKNNNNNHMVFNKMYNTSQLWYLSGFSQLLSVSTCCTMTTIGSVDMVQWSDTTLI